jgi:hypothetical protein
MVKIEIDCESGYSAKEYEKGDTLRYYFRGPAPYANNRGEIGCFDIKGRFAGKFKGADGAPSSFGLVSKEKHAKITLRSPDGNTVFIGNLADTGMTTNDRIVYGMGINNATQYLIASGQAAKMAQTEFIAAGLAYADELLNTYKEHLDL